MTTNGETKGRRNEGAAFTALEILLMKALIVARCGKLETGLTALDADSSAPAGAGGVKKAFSSGTFTHNTLAAVARIAGENLPADELAYRVKRGAGLIPLGGESSAGAGELHAKNLAYRVWVQLTTRVVAHPIDWQNDDLAKVYDSWYESFRRIRQLLEDAALWRDTDIALAKEVLGLVTGLLDGALRPHLTKHQSEFRQWLASPDANTAPLKKLRAQVRQRKYPAFDALAADFVRTQKNAAGCAQQLYAILFPQASSVGRRSH